jgi:hypothetical protein
VRIPFVVRNTFVASGAGSLILKILPGSCILGIFGHALHGLALTRVATMPPNGCFAFTGHPLPPRSSMQPFVGLVVTDSDLSIGPAVRACAEKRLCRPPTSPTKGTCSD